ncbi:MAG TPA: cytochrome P450 [Allosphingosinicella sp.]|nr:cytochrome P450 [Allosphingosinicella sp.]
MTRAPVKDWTTDWDHLDPAWVNDPYSIFSELRETCPVAHTDRYGGAYLLTRHDDIREVAYDPARFSSHRIAVAEDAVNIPTPPITLDPPEHRPIRMLLMPAFTPKAMAKLEPLTRSICNDLLDQIVGKDHCDAAVEYAQNIPVPIIAHMLGIPPEDGDRFRRWVTMSFEDGLDDPDAIRQAVSEMDQYFLQKISERRDNLLDPEDDLTSSLIQARLPNGEPLSDADINDLLRVMLLAGIDTTWSAIGIAIWHLATHPEDRERLVREPELVATAIEEFLRAYAPTIMVREIVEDTIVSGCPLRKGELVVMPVAAATRDPKTVTDAERVVIDREKNQHSAFGMGIHRCVGAPLARMELRIAIEEFLKRIPEFRLDPEGEILWSIGIVRGPRRVPLLLGDKAAA